MFKKLKEKIAEEVKSSPNRIQQFAQAAQAAVSSASSTASESISGGENFFSITEEDTPQNSPQHKPPQHQRTPSTDLQQQFNQNGARSRKLSNSSMASDVSFRLPTYDSPAVYHLQSDLDVSASEVEDTPSASSVATRLEVISKEQLHQAYMKAMERYQKYRGRYQDLAKQYRDLERDNNKARAVLVETQDKALRRISELREQCSLEQQAKAHLEAALRMEMDEMQCVVQTLKQKLQLTGENTDDVIKSSGGVENGNDDLISLGNNGASNLISLEESNQNGNDHQSDVIQKLNEKISKLESTLGEMRKANSEESLKFDTKTKEMNDLNQCLDESRSQIDELKKREEENTILLAENKLMIHTELENKESEVKSLKITIAEFEKDLKRTVDEKETLQAKLEGAKQMDGKYLDKIKLLVTNKKELESKVSEMERCLLNVESAKRELEAKIIILQNDKTTALAEVENKVEKIQREKTESSKEQNKTKTEHELLIGKLKELQQKYKNLEQKHDEEINGHKKQLSDLQKIANDWKTKHEQQKADNLAFEERLNVMSEDKLKQLQQLEELSQAEISLKEQTEKERCALKSEIDLLTNQINLLEEEKQTMSIQSEDIRKQFLELKADCENLNERNKTLFEDLQSERNTLEKDKKSIIEQLKQVTDEKQKMCDELNGQIQILKTESDSLNEKCRSLTEENKNSKILNENSESEAIKALQVSMKENANQFEERLAVASAEVSQRDSRQKELELKVAEFEKQFTSSLQEKEDSQRDLSGLRTKVDALKVEKRDLEKTLEKEIRDKTELKTQVTNILQEIGRLEEQLKEVKSSHSEMQQEKTTLEEKIDHLQKSVQTEKSKVEKDQNQKWQSKIKEFEIKLLEIQCENSQLAEKNCLLEENNGRLQNTLKENEINFKKEKNDINMALKIAEDSLNTIRLENEIAKETVNKLNEKMSQCLDENSRLFNAKELLDHEYRSLQDQMEATDKEKLCVLDSSKCQEDELKVLREENLKLKTIERETHNLGETCDKMRVDLCELQAENESLRENRDELQMKVNELTSEAHQINVQKSSLSEEVDRLKLRLAAVEQTSAQQISEYENVSKSRTTELESLLKQANDEKSSLKNSIKNNAELQKQVEQLEQVQIENEYLNTSIKQLESDLTNAKDENTKLLGEITELENKVKSQQCELYVKEEHNVKEKDENTAEVKRLQSDCEQAKSFSETCKTETDRLRNQLKQLEASKQQLEECIQNSSKEAGTFKDKATTLDDENGVLKRDIQALKTERDGLKIEVSHFKKESEDFKRECDGFKKVVENLKTQSDDHKSNLDNSRNEIDRTKIERDSLKSDLDALKTKANGLTEEQNALKTENADLKKQLEAKSSDADSLRLETDTLRKEIDSSRAIISGLNSDMNEQSEQLEQQQIFATQNDELKQQIAELQSQLKALELQTVQRPVSPKTEELDTLRRTVEELRLQLAEQQITSEGKLSNLNHEIDELLENAKAYKEKHADWEELQQENKQLREKVEKISNSSEGGYSSEELVSIQSERDDLDIKLKKIMHEVQDVSNRNLFLEQKCENYLILEQSNERLKLANDKLTRQLDETLVSLHHNEGISANTEFEYLKNIMFQYLTGNVASNNNSTLVKVIAAVLKFSPQQTQVVLEKETQRNSLVGQFNKIL